MNYEIINRKNHWEDRYVDHNGHTNYYQILQELDITKYPEQPDKDYFEEYWSGSIYFKGHKISIASLESLNHLELLVSKMKSEWQAALQDSQEV